MCGEFFRCVISIWLFEKGYLISLQSPKEGYISPPFGKGRWGGIL
jgi:hypothetical protein